LCICQYQAIQNQAKIKQKPLNFNKDTTKKGQSQWKNECSRQNVIP